MYILYLQLFFYKSYSKLEHFESKTIFMFECSVLSGTRYFRPQQRHSITPCSAKRLFNVRLTERTLTKAKGDTMSLATKTSRFISGVYTCTRSVTDRAAICVGSNHCGNNAIRPSFATSCFSTSSAFHPTKHKAYLLLVGGASLALPHT